MANKVAKKDTKALTTTKEVQPKNQKAPAQTKQGKEPNTNAKGAQSTKVPSQKKNSKKSSGSDESEEQSDDIEINSQSEEEEEEVHQVPVDGSDDESGNGNEDGDDQEDSEDSNQASNSLKRKFDGRDEPSKKFSRNDTSEKTPAKVHKIFIRGLPFKTTEDELHQFFDGCGNIVNSEIIMQSDGRASGTAYVTFSDESAFKSALEMNGQQMGTRWLDISEARAGSGEKRNNAAVAFIGNLPFDATSDDLQGLFSSCGEIKSIRIATHQDTGKPRGFAHIEFEDEESVQKAKDMHDVELNGRTLRIDSSEPSGGFRGGRGGRDFGGRGGGRDFGGRGGGRDFGGRGGRGGRDFGGRGGRGGRDFGGRGGGRDFGGRGGGRDFGGRGGSRGRGGRDFGGRGDW